MEHLDNLQILTDAQHGFRKKRSTVSQLIKTTLDLSSSLEDKKVRDVIFLDYSKVFDKVPHKRLIHKINHYGIRGSTCKWIANFLHNRNQEVIIDGTTSSSTPVHSGVPQGTVLGPLLFLLYINDLPESISPGSDTGLYADDSALSTEMTSARDVKTLQEDLDRLQDWERKWLMEFNPGKCQAMRVTNKQNPGKPEYTIHGQQLEAVTHAKYLGVTITKDLKWSRHITETTRKADNTRAFLARNIKGCKQETKKQCYTTMVRPILEYASDVWDPHQANDTARLEKVQRRSARFITRNFRREASVNAMLQELNIPLLKERRAHSKVTTLYKALNGDLEIPTSPLIPTLSTTRGHTKRYLVPSSRLVTTKGSFYPDTIRLWNSLPASVVESPSLELFKTRLQPLTLRP